MLRSNITNDPSMNCEKDSNDIGGAKLDKSNVACLWHLYTVQKGGKSVTFELLSTNRNFDKAWTLWKTQSDTFRLLWRFKNFKTSRVVISSISFSMIRVRQLHWYHVKLYLSGWRWVGRRKWTVWKCPLTGPHRSL